MKGFKCATPLKRVSRVMCESSRCVNASREGRKKATRFFGGVASFVRFHPGVNSDNFSGFTVRARVLKGNPRNRRPRRTSLKSLSLSLSKGIIFAFHFFREKRKVAPSSREILFRCFFQLRYRGKMCDKF